MGNLGVLVQRVQMASAILDVRQTMSAPATDISQLSEEQQLALQQVTSVTDQDLDAALALLQRCQWNAQVPRIIPSVQLPD
jgi:hypothetical protein